MFGLYPPSWQNHNIERAHTRTLTHTHFTHTHSLTHFTLTLTLTLTLTHFTPTLRTQTLHIRTLSLTQVVIRGKNGDYDNAELILGRRQLHVVFREVPVVQLEYSGPSVPLRAASCRVVWLCVKSVCLSMMSVMSGCRCLSVCRCLSGLSV